MNRDLYEILGANKNDSEKALLAAYRRRVKQTHPDYGGDRDEFELVVSAWTILCDPERRKTYDETGIVDLEFATITKRRMMDMMAEGVSAILDNLNGPIENLNFIETLRNLSREALGRLKADHEAKLGKLRQFVQLRDSIKRKDEAENLFVDMLQPKIDAAREEVVEAAHAVYINRMFLTELENYESPVSVIRSMQAWFYATSERYSAYGNEFSGYLTK